MPVIASSKKALRRDKRRTVVNKRIRIKVKESLDIAKKDASKENIASGFSALDRAAKKGVMHKNKAARLKSRLSKAVSSTPTPKSTRSPKKKPSKTRKNT